MYICEYKWFIYANYLTGYATFACIQLLLNIIFVVMVDFIEPINIIYASNFIFKLRFAFTTHKICNFDLFWWYNFKF